MRPRLLLIWACFVALWIPRVAAAALDPVDRSTPQRTVAGFLRAMEDENLADAGKFLDRRQRPPQGLHWSDVAERLEAALQMRMLLDLDAISDVPEGDPADGASTERIGLVEDERGGIPITLERIKHGGRSVWVFSAQTLHALPDIHAPPPSVSPLVDLLPQGWREREFAGLWSWQWLGLALALLVALPFGYGIGRLVSSAAVRLARATSSAWDDAVVEHTQSGIRFVLAWLCFAVVVENLGLPPTLDRWVDIFTRTPLILALGWMTRAAIRAATSVYLERTPDDEELNSRGLRTQINILRRLSTVAIVIITASLVLLQFDVVRNVGLSLLASAGVAGVAVGFAAKESLANVIAGLQLSMSQTIRLGDVVVIEGQWGRVEEIALTYVRLSLFDDRHLVVPVASLLNNSLENWSAPRNGLIGVVELAVDPTTPIGALRQAVERIAGEHDNHDGRDLRVQVLELDERRAWIRIRVSSRELSRTFQMRCEIREALLRHLQEWEGGRYLAKQRFERVEPASGE